MHISKKRTHMSECGSYSQVAAKPAKNITIQERKSLIQWQCVALIKHDLRKGSQSLEN